MSAETKEHSYMIDPQISTERKTKFRASERRQSHSLCFTIIFSSMNLTHYKDEELQNILQTFKLTTN